MKRVEIAIIIILLTTTSCLNQRNSRRLNEKQMVRIYSNFIDQIPNIKLPINLSCGFDSCLVYQNMKDELRPFTPAGYRIVGKIESNLNFHLILCTSIENKYYPHLYITDLKGNDLDFYPLYNKICFESQSHQVKTNTIIDEHFSIQIIDSLRYNKDLYDSIIVSQVYLTIRKDGKIKSILPPIQKE